MKRLGAATRLTEQVADGKKGTKQRKWDLHECSFGVGGGLSALSKGIGLFEI